MALADILTKIKSDAERESKQIAHSAEEEASHIIARAKARVEEIQRVGNDDALRASSKARGRIIAAATHEAKFTSQAFRVSLIDRVFENVEKQLKSIPADAYKAFVTARAESLPEKTGTITVAEERKEETLSALKNAGVETKDVTTAKLIGGFILETTSAVYDHSLKALAQSTREHYASLVARELFKKS